MKTKRINGQNGKRGFKKGLKQGSKSFSIKEGKQKKEVEGDGGKEGSNGGRKGEEEVKLTERGHIRKQKDKRKGSKKNRSKKTRMDRR